MVWTITSPKCGENLDMPLTLILFCYKDLFGCLYSLKAELLKRGSNNCPPYTLQDFTYFQVCAWLIHVCQKYKWNNKLVGRFQEPWRSEASPYYKLTNQLATQSWMLTEDVRLLETDLKTILTAKAVARMSAWFHSFLELQSHRAMQVVLTILHK